MNYFDILNIAENAEEEVIRASYKALAKKYHPDNSNGSIEESKQKMMLMVKTRWRCWT